MEYFFTYLRAHHEKSEYKGHDTLEEYSQKICVYSEHAIYSRIDMEDIDVMKERKEWISKTW